jgi:hypothetical protein
MATYERRLCCQYFRGTYCIYIQDRKGKWYVIRGQGPRIYEAQWELLLHKQGSYTED